MTADNPLLLGSGIDRIRRLWNAENGAARAIAVNKIVAILGSPPTLSQHARGAASNSKQEKLGVVQRHTAHRHDRDVSRSRRPRCIAVSEQLTHLMIVHAFAAGDTFENSRSDGAESIARVIGQRPTGTVAQRSAERAHAVVAQDRVQ